MLRFHITNYYGIPHSSTIHEYTNYLNYSVLSISTVTLYIMQMLCSTKEVHLEQMFSYMLYVKNCACNK